ncbi:MAG: hypothetical protein AAF998_23345 [Bacteroidota bacterium]
MNPETKYLACCDCGKALDLSVCLHGPIMFRFMLDHEGHTLRLLGESDANLEGADVFLSYHQTRPEPVYKMSEIPRHE